MNCASIVVRRDSLPADTRCTERTVHRIEPYSPRLIHAAASGLRRHCRGTQLGERAPRQCAQPCV